MFRRHVVPQREKESFGRVIRAHRKLIGYTPEDLSAKLGWSTHWINDIENGKGVPSGLDVVRLLATLRLDSEQVVREADLFVSLPAD